MLKYVVEWIECGDMSEISVMIFKSSYSVNIVPRPKSVQYLTLSF